MSLYHVGRFCGPGLEVTNHFSSHSISSVLKREQSKIRLATQNPNTSPLFSFIHTTFSPFVFFFPFLIAKILKQEQSTCFWYSYSSWNLCFLLPHSPESDQWSTTVKVQWHLLFSDSASLHPSLSSYPYIYCWI